MQTSVLCTPGSRAHFAAMMSHNARAARGEVGMPPQTPQALARHEAAHALAALRVGATFEEIALTLDDPASLGHAHSTFREADGSRVRAIRPIAVLWAGAVQDGHVFSAGPDLEEIVKIAGAAGSPISLAGFKVAALIVEQFRPEIEAVAQRLEQAHRLSYAEVVEIVTAPRLSDELLAIANLVLSDGMANEQSLLTQE